MFSRKQANLDHPVLTADIAALIRQKPTVARKVRMDVLPDIALSTHVGNTNLSKLITNKGIVLQYFYTRCNGTCPNTTEKLKQVAKLLGPRLGRDLIILSLSLDPAQDTLGDLKKYAEQHQLPSGWFVASSSARDLNTMFRHFNLSAVGKQGPGKPITHTTEIFYGSNASGRWRMVDAQFPKPQLMVDLIEMTVDGLSYKRPKS